MQWLIVVAGVAVLLGGCVARQELSGRVVLPSGRIVQVDPGPVATGQEVVSPAAALPVVVAPSGS